MPKTPKKKKAKVKETPKNKVYILYDEYRSGGSICEGQEKDDWPSHEDEQNHVTWKSAHRSNTGMVYNETVEVDFDPASIDYVIMVVVMYYDGGTFGRTCGLWQIIGVYPSIQDARKAEQSIKDNTFQGGKGWEGYFAGLESVEIEVLRLLD